MPLIEVCLDVCARKYIVYIHVCMRINKCDSKFCFQIQSINQSISVCESESDVIVCVCVGASVFSFLYLRRFQHDLFGCVFFLRLCFGLVC